MKMFWVFVTVCCLYFARCCDVGWSSYNGKCYKVFLDPQMTWIEASPYCQSLSGDLVSITSESENQFLTSFITPHGGRFWLGLNDAIDESVYVWSDGTTGSYYNWGDEEPNNEGDQDCVVITTKGDWYDEQCSTVQYNVVCATIDTNSSNSEMCDWELQCKAPGRRKRSKQYSQFRKIRRSNGGIVLVPNE